MTTQADDGSLNDLLLTKSEAASLLRVTTRTLENWEKRNEGPPYAKVGGSIRYPRTWLDKWILARAEQAAE